MPTDDPEWRKALSLVGEIVQLASALDHQLTHVVISILHLTNSPLLEPVIATLDSSRKVEILKGRAKHIKQHEWRKPIEKYVDLVEQVNKARNIACHSQLLRNDSRFEFSSSQAAKLFKGLKLEDVPTVERTPLETIATNILTAEKALGSGQNLMENFERFHQELERRRSKQSSRKYSA